MEELWGVTHTQLSWNAVAWFVSKRVPGEQTAPAGRHGISCVESHETDRQIIADKFK